MQKQVSTRHYAPAFIFNPNMPVSVHLIGVGGTGSQVLGQLVRIHLALKELGKPGLFVMAFDPDIVTPANRGRQNFSPKDVGQYKAKVLITRINAYTGTNWVGVAMKYEDIVKKPGMTIVACNANFTITCVDSAKARFSIKDALYQYRRDGDRHPSLEKYYWLDMGNTKYTGQVILSTLENIPQPPSEKFNAVSELPSILDLYPDLEAHDNEEEQGPSCSLREALEQQSMFIGTSMSMLGCDLIWRLMHEGYVDTAEIYFNLRNHNSSEMPIPEVPGVYYAFSYNPRWGDLGHLRFGSALEARIKAEELVTTTQHKRIGILSCKGYAHSPSGHRCLKWVSRTKLKNEKKRHSNAETLLNK